MSVLEKLLIEIGISIPQQLRKNGAKEAFIRIRTKDPTVCIHMLYGIQGAVEGIKDKFFTDNTKQELKIYIKNYKTKSSFVVSIRILAIKRINTRFN